MSNAKKKKNGIDNTLKKIIIIFLLFCGVSLNLIILLSKHSSKLADVQLTMTISADKRGDYKVYYSDSKQFYEEQSNWLNYLEEQEKQKLEFFFPFDTNYIRIDFPETKGRIEISDIKFQYKKNEIELNDEKINNSETSQITWHKENDKYIVETEEGDPYFLIDISDLPLQKYKNDYNNYYNICKIILCLFLDIILLILCIKIKKDSVKYEKIGRKFLELYLYRQMIFSLVQRELRGRYKGSILGFLWTFLNPLLQLIVYTMVFSVIMKNDIEKYYIFLFVALVPWMLISSAMVSGSTCILNSTDMVKKIYFPREVLPIANTLSNLVNMILCFCVVYAVLLFTGYGINIVASLYMPIIMLVEFMLALGIALLTSALTVYMRDIAYILSIISMAWQFLTPIMYSVDMVPEKLLPIFNINPVTPIINAYRDILYYKTIPDISTLTNAFLFGMAILILGEIVFLKLQRGFCEEL